MQANLLAGLRLRLNDRLVVEEGLELVCWLHSESALFAFGSQVRMSDLGENDVLEPFFILHDFLLQFVELRPQVQLAVAPHLFCAIEDPLDAHSAIAVVEVLAVDLLAQRLIRIVFLSSINLANLIALI